MCCCVFGVGVGIGSVDFPPQFCTSFALGEPATSKHVLLFCTQYEISQEKALKIIIMITRTHHTSEKNPIYPSTISEHRPLLGLLATMLLQLIDRY